MASEVLSRALLVTLDQATATSSVVYLASVAQARPLSLCLVSSRNLSKLFLIIHINIIMTAPFFIFSLFTWFLHRCQQTSLALTLARPARPHKNTFFQEVGAESPGPLRLSKANLERVLLSRLTEPPPAVASEPPFRYLLGHAHYSYPSLRHGP